MRAIVPIADLGSRVVEAGRIRLGEKVKGPRRFASLNTFRFTSQYGELIEQLATMYGGKAAPWHDDKASPKDQWQVTTETNEIDVVVLPHGLHQTYELWTGGGMARSCDGVECDVKDLRNDDGDPHMVPCLCERAGMLECKPKVRVQLLLPDLPFRGSWRLETSSWNAMHEIPGMFRLLEEMGRMGRTTPALLSIDQRQKKMLTKKGPQTKHFVVPRLTAKESINELAAGGPGLALGTGAPNPFVKELPRGTPEVVPAAPNPYAVDAEVVDAEVVSQLDELREHLRSDAVFFDLDPDRFVAAVERQAKGDETRMRAARDRMVAGKLVPRGFLPDGDVDWEVIPDE